MTRLTRVYSITDLLRSERPDRKAKIKAVIDVQLCQVQRLLHHQNQQNPQQGMIREQLGI